MRFANFGVGITRSFFSALYTASCELSSQCRLLSSRHSRPTVLRNPQTEKHG